MKSLFAASTALLLWLTAVAAEPIATTKVPTTTSCQTCYTRTTTKPVPCPTGTFDPSTCIRPACVIVTTQTIGTKSCSKVVTEASKCETACPTGCNTFTETVTNSARCLSSQPCYTAYTTVSTAPICPQIICSGTPTGCGPKTTTITRSGPAPGVTCTTTSTVTTGMCPPNGCACTTTTTYVTATPKA